MCYVSSLSPSSVVFVAVPSRGSPKLTLQRSFSSVSNLSDTGKSTFSDASYRTKYEPLRSVHADIQDVFLRPQRKLYSRGHEIPEPSFHSPSGGSVGGRAVSRGSTKFDSTSRNNANVQARPHTSGTALPSCYSPIRPTERGKNLFSRASSPVMLRHGEHFTEVFQASTLALHAYYSSITTIVALLILRKSLSISIRSCYFSGHFREKVSLPP